MATVVRFKQPYQNYSPDTLFQVDQQTKTLSPFSSGQAFTNAGFQFGQVDAVDDPNQFAGFAVGPNINTRAAALGQVKTELNNFQNDTFSQETAAPKRASSALEERVSSETQTLNDALAEFKTLSDKYKALENPNYEQAYTDLRTKQGVPQLEEDFLGVRKTRRELPYTERASTGNAGVATESQLQSQTAQKDIPLEAREANLIDRLKLASDFVNTSLKLKEMDATSARTAIENAINLVGQTINLSRTEQDRNRARADKALEFALNNNINTPAFVVGNQAYDAKTLDPISLEQYQTLTGQNVGLSEGETDFGPRLLTRIEGGKQEEKALVIDLISKYPDAGISPSDSFVVASSKLKSSRIYQEQIRPPTNPSMQKTNQQQTIITNAANTFAGSKGNDGYVDPDKYRELKRQYIAAGGSASDFMQALPVEQYISPANQKGDLVQTSGSRDVNQDARLQQLLQKSNNGQDLDKLSPEEQIELYSLL